MIFTALAHPIGADDVQALPFGYAWKPLGYTLSLWQDGLGCQLISHHDDKGKPVGAVIPNLARSGTKPKPYLGCDVAAYVIGRGKLSESAEKTQAKHDAFVRLLTDYVLQSGDAVGSLFLRWLENGMPGLDDALGSLSTLAQRRLDMDPMAIAVEGRRAALHENVPAQVYWAEYARGAKSSGAHTLCLSCGNWRTPVATLPQSLIGHLVPGATQANVSLASINFPAASRGASGTGLRSAPLCADCAAHAVQNFNALAGSVDSAWRSPGGDLGMIWWASGTRRDPIVGLVLRPDPKPVADLMRAPRSADGELWQPGPGDRFFALTFSGNVSRLAVRRWMELPLATIHARVFAWFTDVESPNHEHPYFPLFRYATSLGPMTRQHSKWVTTAPEGAVEALLMTALAGHPVPPHFLRLALSRASAEVRSTNSDDGLTAGLVRLRLDARAGLLRLILNRSTLKENPMPAHLDESRDDPAYVSGRLFAVRESLQSRALGHVNASIVDKYYERASSNPASVAQALDVLSKQHLRALRREKGEGVYLREDAVITALNAMQGDAPGRLTAEEQAAWLCGYHQQRMHDIEAARTRAKARALGDFQTPPADNTDQD